MQVRSPALQHAVMIEAVENHMPEVIVIDEIGTEADADAARTIAERGVQLVATAHGNTLDNLIMNPTLSDLVGGVEAVTLGDIEARRRGTQKTVRERRAPPTFDILVEIQGWNEVVVHEDVSDVVDRMLRGNPISPQLRTVDELGRLQTLTCRDESRHAFQQWQRQRRQARYAETRLGAIYAGRACGRRADEVGEHSALRDKQGQADASGAKHQRRRWNLSADLGKADMLLTTKNYYRRRHAGAATGGTARQAGVCAAKEHAGADSAVRAGADAKTVAGRADEDGALGRDRRSRASGFTACPRARCR